MLYSLHLREQADMAALRGEKKISLKKFGQHLGVFGSTAYCFVKSRKKPSQNFVEDDGEIF